MLRSHPTRESPPRPEPHPPPLDLEPNTTDTPKPKFHVVITKPKKEHASSSTSYPSSKRKRSTGLNDSPTALHDAVPNKEGSSVEGRHDFGREINLVKGEVKRRDYIQINENSGHIDLTLPQATHDETSPDQNIAEHSMRPTKHNNNLEVLFYKGSTSTTAHSPMRTVYTQVSSVVTVNQRTGKPLHHHSRELLEEVVILPKDPRRQPPRGKWDAELEAFARRRRMELAHQDSGFMQDPNHKDGHRTTNSSVDSVTTIPDLDKASSDE